MSSKESKKIHCKIHRIKIDHIHRVKIHRVKIEVHMRIDSRGYITATPPNYSYGSQEATFLLFIYITKMLNPYYVYFPNCSIFLALSD